MWSKGVIDYDSGVCCFYPVVLRKAKIVCNFGLSECNRVKEVTTTAKIRIALDPCSLLLRFRNKVLGVKNCQNASQGNLVGLSKETTIKRNKIQTCCLLIFYKPYKNFHPDANSIRCFHCLPFTWSVHLFSTTVLMSILISNIS